MRLRGMRVLPDRCPKHKALPVWYSLVEVAVHPTTCEVGRYDCGCLLTVDPDTMGAPMVREEVVAAREEEE